MLRQFLMINFYFLVAGGEGGTSESEFATGLHRILAILFVCVIHGFYGTPKDIHCASSQVADYLSSAIVGLESAELCALVGSYAAYGGTSRRKPGITHDYVLFTLSSFSRITAVSRNI
jgi:hypothetical protein